MILDGSGRFVLHSKPPAFPFIDVVTGAPEGPVFDLSVDLDYYNGVVYVKAEHVEEMARTLGMEYKKEADPVSAETNNEVESLINGIDDILRAYRPAPVPVVSAPVYLLDSYKESGEVGGTESVQPEGTDSESGKGEIELPRIVSDDSEQLKADGPSKPAEQISKPALNKGPAKLSAGSGNGLEF